MWRTLCERYSRQPQSPRAQYRGIPTTTTCDRGGDPSGATAQDGGRPERLFATNSDRIAPKYYTDLNKLGEALTRVPSTVEIAGYTDSIGSDQLNQVLSERRARSVKQYLEQHFSLPAERLIAKGYGESRPRAPNETESGRRQNRRIEVALPQP